MSDFNSTEPMVQSGGQAEAVAPQEQSPTGPASTAGSAGGAYITPTAEAVGQESVVGSYQNADFTLVDNVGGDGEGGETLSEPDGAGQAVAQQQTREENAAIRAARIRARREAAAEERARLDEEIAELGIENPYNGNKPFANLNEMREYSEQFRQAKLQAEANRTGRSVQDLSEDAANREYIRRKRREEAEQAAAQAQAEAQRQFFADDVRDFMEKYPQFDAKQLDALENNKQFRQFCGSRFGREPLAQLYGDYIAIVGGAGEAAIAKAAGKAARSTGGGTAGGAVLSPSQKVALDKWNEEHPEMAMTPKEFLGR